MWFLWKMSNYPTAWHENMNYLKLLMSDKLSTVEVSVQQPPSVCNVGGIIKWESIKFCFPDKSSTPKEAENHLLRLGLHLMPVHALWPPKLQMSAVTLLWGVLDKSLEPGGLHSFSCCVTAELWAGQMLQADLVELQLLLQTKTK